MGCHLILDFNEVTTVDMNDYNFMYIKLIKIFTLFYKIITSIGTIF
jgi:hypothetical protein